MTHKNGCMFCRQNKFIRQIVFVFHLDEDGCDSSNEISKTIDLDLNNYQIIWSKLQYTI